MKRLANSRSEDEYKVLLLTLKNNSNENFMEYLKKDLQRKSRWVFCFMDPKHRSIRTNLHIESFHRTLKYKYLNGKKNKRVDRLIFQLRTVSDDFKYKQMVQENKGARTTFRRKISERHNISKGISMNFFADSKKIQVTSIN